MTLLEKLNLEPGAVPTHQQKVVMVDSLSDNPYFTEYYRLRAHAISLTPTLTNAEFLAACEEWLKKN